MYVLCVLCVVVVCDVFIDDFVYVVDYVIFVIKLCITFYYEFGGVFVER